MHWNVNDIYTFLDYIVESNKFKYILLVNDFGQESDNTNINTGDFRPLSVDFFPLKKYNPNKIFNYRNKEVSIINF